MKIRFWHILLPHAVILSLLAGSGCKTPIGTPVWVKQFPEAGSSASPQCADLNRDGILDVVLGAGKNEFEATDSGVLALDGRNGDLLWTYPVKDQIVGTPVFLDITQDGIPEVFLGGRSAQFFAINGKDGSPVWEYNWNDQPLTPILQYLRFNFYSPQIIPDQNKDGLPDLLVASGGNVLAVAGSEQNRFPGLLVIFNSKNGEILAADTMPDGKETYMSPLVHDFKGKGQLEVIFGTGGETAGGSLYRANLDLISQSQLVKAKRLISREEKGFIAPPLITDLNNDGVREIVANWHGGATYAIDGLSNTLIWELEVPNTETYASITPGRANDDDIPDLFTTFNRGHWPENTGSIQILIDGKNGEILHQDSLGCAGYASAVSFDFNQDGYDEFLFHVNSYNCDGIFLGEVKYDLVLFDYRNQVYHYLLDSQFAKNVSTTPWLGDLDGNGFFDIVYCTQANTTKIYTYFGLVIHRLTTQIPTGEKSYWGAYMGNRSAGIFEF